MKNLKEFLQNVEHKSGLITLLLAMLLFIQGSETLLTSHTIAVMEVVCGGLLLFFKMFAPSGSLPKGWTTWFYLSNGLIFLTQVGDLFSSSGMFSVVAMAMIAKIQVLLNAGFAATQMYTSANTKVVA